MIILQKQLKLKLKFRPFTLSVLALCFLFLSSTLLADSYTDIGEHFLHGLVPANYLRINSQPFTPAFSTSLQPEILEIAEIPELFDNSAWHFPANTTNNSANDPSVNSVNLAYQYEDQDMNALLQLRVQEEAEAEGLNIENIVILPPLADTEGELVIQLREESERYSKNIAVGVIPHERTILLPLNLSRVHWVGIVIRLDSDNDVISIIYIDSLGCRIPEHIRGLLQDVYGGDINIEAAYGLIQIDDTGCGPLMIENLIREVRGVRGDFYVSDDLMRRIRAHHVNLLETHRPDLRFKKRQQNNVRSFKDTNGEIVRAIIGGQSIDTIICQEAGINLVVCGGGRTKVVKQKGSSKKEDLSETTNEQDLSPTPNWDSLPDELKFEIMDYLNPKKLAKVAQVSKEWNRIANDNVLWRHKLQENFGERKINDALDIYNKMGYPLLTIEGGRETIEVSNYKLVYRICGLLRSFGKSKTKIKLRRERSELIEANNKTPDFSIQKLIEDITSSNSKAKALVINRIVINGNEAQRLVDALKNENCKVTELNLRYSQIGAAGTAALANALKDKNCKITELDLWESRIGDAGARDLALALKDPNCKVTELDFYGNQIGDAGAEAIANTLKDPNCKVTELELGHNRIGDAGAQAIADALKNESCKVTKLRLYLNQIGDAGAKALADSLKDKNCKITELELGDNGIGNAGAQAIADALKNESCKVTTPNLCWNQIDAAGARDLALALKDPNCKVAELDFAGNRIGDAGARDLAFALKDPNCKITELELGYNQIDAAGAGALADALKDPNCKLTKLNLKDNNIGYVGVQALADTLKNPNCKLTELELSENGISDAGARDLADALKNENCKLTELNLEHNQIGEAGAEALAKAVINVRNQFTRGREIKITGLYNFEDLLRNVEAETKPAGRCTIM